MSNTPSAHALRLFEDLLAIDPARREEWIAARALPPAVAGHLQRLLAADAQGELAGLQPPAALAEGQRLGRFTLLRPLGAGAMGSVWEATQDEPQRRVALKLLDRLPLTAAALRRFRLEAEALARLQHPHIVPVHDTGLFDLGGRAVPWLSMELVRDARPLPAHARGLDLRTRLELLRQTCAAVQHGHERGVLHRDLKPANVLVDGEGRVRLIDFGVARLLDAQRRELTLTGQVVGTLPYASPEQLAGRPDEVSVRSDLHALGLLLYELLAGRPARDLSGLPLAEALERLRTTRVPRPSQAAPGLPRDLDWIVLRATDPDPARRYASAAELSEELARVLRHEPALAGPPSATHEAALFLRRHRVGTSAAAAVLLALVAGLAVALSALGREREARAGADAAASRARAAEARAAEDALRAERGAEDARRQALRAQGMLEFLRDSLRAPSPYARGTDVRLVDVLDDALTRLARDTSLEPHDAALLQADLGRVLVDRGATGRGLPLLAQALACLPAEDPQRPYLLLDLARAQEAAASPEDARLALLEALATLPPGIPSRTSAHFRATLASVLLSAGRLDEALPLADAALADVLATDGPFTADALGALAVRATLDFQRGDPAAARRLVELGCAAADAGAWRDDPRWWVFEEMRAALLVLDGHIAEGLEALRAVIARWEAAGLPAHPACLVALNNQALMLLGFGRQAEALEVALQAHALSRTALGAEHPETLMAAYNAGMLLTMQGRDGEARELALDAAERARELPREHRVRMLLGLEAGEQHERAGRPEEAVAWNLRAFDECEVAGPLGDSLRFHALRVAGRNLSRLGRHEEAVAVLARAAAEPEATPEISLESRGGVQMWLSRSLEALGRTLEARDAAAAGVERARAARLRSNAMELELRRTVGRMSGAALDLATALRELSAVARAKPSDAVARTTVLRATREWAEVYLKADCPDEAEGVLELLLETSDDPEVTRAAEEALARLRAGSVAP